MDIITACIIILFLFFFILSTLIPVDSIETALQNLEHQRQEMLTLIETQLWKTYCAELELTREEIEEVPGNLAIIEEVRGRMYTKYVQKYDRYITALQAFA